MNRGSPEEVFVLEIFIDEEPPEFLSEDFNTPEDVEGEDYVNDFSLFDWFGLENDDDDE